MFAKKIVYPVSVQAGRSIVDDNGIELFSLSKEKVSPVLMDLIAHYLVKKLNDDRPYSLQAIHPDDRSKFYPFDMNYDIDE